jgi:membrane fusion protein (multidrug efflux system)
MAGSRLEELGMKIRPRNLLIVSFLALAGCNQSQQQAAAPAAPPPAVGVKAAETKGVARAYSFVGRIKAIQIVALRARVQGFLDKVLFTEGQDVKTGDLLFQIEKVQYQAQVDQAEANLASAKAQTVNAQLQFNRAADLVKSSAGTQSTVDQTRAALEVAQASVLQNQAALTQAKVNLDYTDIRSPIDGRIGRTTYTQGNLVGPTSDVLATIVSQDPIYVQFPVSVRELQEIRKSRRQEDGRLIKIDIVARLPSGEEYAHPGVWNYTDPQVDQPTDTLLMRGTLPNPERQLVDGEFVTVEVRERQQQPRLVVPQSALQVDQGGDYVLVVGADKKVELRRVKTGENSDTDVVVESGLSAGDAVIVDGVQKVRPGQVVNATPVTAATAEAKP